MSVGEICVPGQLLVRLDDSVVAGDGTYSRNGCIYSSLAGFKKMSKTTENKTCIEVHREAEKSNIVPTVGSLVTVKIKSVNPRYCKCDIFAVEKTLLKEPFRGHIWKEDVRATERDKVELSKCFKPTDIALARVLSLGDAHSYFLTTAENELGVVIATSESGEKMVPISWQEMQCPKTYAKEYRKVAKVQPQHIVYSGGDS